MVEIKLSERAQKIFNYFSLPISPSPEAGEGLGVRFLRQQTLAEQFNCSRRTIGRALKELKDAGLLIDLNKRHANRCKLYEIKTNPHPTGEGERQLKLYRFTFEANFKDWPDWEKYYPQVTRELAPGLDPGQLFRQTFDGLYAIQAAQTTLSESSYLELGYRGNPGKHICDVVVCR